MTLNQVKLFAAVLFILPAIALAIFNTKPLGTIVNAADAAETYRTKCAMCHSPKAEKAFDPAKTDEELVEIIMKGKKGEKPPFMPGFEAKGMTAEQAKELVTFMKQLRMPGNANTNANTSVNANTNTNVNANVNANANVNVNAKANVDANANSKAIEGIAATYKTKCAMCHSPKAEKFFDTAKTEEVLAEIILKGKKGEKPPFMPGFEEKSMTAEQARELVAYMKCLRMPSE